MVTRSSRLALSPHARFRRFDEEGVIVQQESAEAIVVNDCGARLLELSDGARTFGECVDTITEEYDGEPEAIARDLVTYAGELAAAGVVIVSEPADAHGP
jgi:hypothetical protein